MKNIFKILGAIVLTGFVFTSCETVELEDLTSPNGLSPSQADASLLFNQIQLGYNSSQGTFHERGADLGRINYMFGRNYFNNAGSGSMGNPWNQLYTNINVNLMAIEGIQAADASKDLSFVIGASKVLQAHLMMQLVDYLGDIPWSEANDPSNFPKPGVDDDQDVYTAALAILSEGKSILNSSGGAGTATDLFYGGDVSKWIKLANTIKMRADLTVGNYSAVASATDVIMDEADDFQFSYGTSELQPDTRHPSYAADYTDSGANIYQSNWLINLMVGPYGDLSNNTDPRRRYYFYRQTWRTPGNYALFEDVNGAFGPAGNVYVSNGSPNLETLQCSDEDVPTHLQFTPDEDIWCSMHLGYWGRFHGDDDGTPPDNFTRTAEGVYPSGGSFDWRSDAFPYVGASPTATFGQAVGLGKGGGGAGIRPIMLASYVDFMKAEANLALGNTSAAATHFENGMRKSITKVMSFGSLDAGADMSNAPSSTTVDDFITLKVDEFNAASTSTGVDGSGFPTAKDKMDLLGEQYFVAMFGGATDAFNFIRRTGYPRTMSRSLEENPGTFPRTYLYPGGEVSANSNIQQRTDNATLVFWDNGTLNPAN